MFLQNAPNRTAPDFDVEIGQSTVNTCVAPIGILVGHPHDELLDVVDPVDRSMVEAISPVGKSMAIQTIAGRVESAQVLTELGRLGIGFAQGFHIAEPCCTQVFPHVRDKILPD
jgi:hypothetical protein